MEKKAKSESSIAVNTKHMQNALPKQTPRRKISISIVGEKW